MMPEFRIVYETKTDIRRDKKGLGERKKVENLGVSETFRTFAVDFQKTCFLP